MEELFYGIRSMLFPLPPFLAETGTIIQLYLLAMEWLILLLK